MQLLAVTLIIVVLASSGKGISSLVIIKLIQSHTKIISSIGMVFITKDIKLSISIKKTTFFMIFVFITFQIGGINRFLTYDGLSRLTF